MLYEINKDRVSSIFQDRLLDLISDFECRKKDLPEFLGVSKAVITRALNYGIVPKPLSLMKIADKLEVSIEYLLGRTDKTHYVKSDCNMTFQMRFDELKSKRKLKNNQISVLLHIDRSYFSIWNRENYIPSLEFLISIADYFKVSIDYLLGRTDDGEPLSDI